MKAWTNDLNTTTYRITWSVHLAAFCIVVIVPSMILFKWEPTAMQLKVLIGIAGGILTMMGFDVLQFIGKRFSDSAYVAAKNPQTIVNAEAPSTVEVKSDKPVEVKKTSEFNPDTDTGD